MTQLILIRHGQSQWNLENRFTGFHDVDLTKTGLKEAEKAAKLIKKEGITLDVGFTSFQRRAIKTLWLTLEGIDQLHIPVTKNFQRADRPASESWVKCHYLGPWKFSARHFERDFQGRR